MVWRRGIHRTCQVSGSEVSFPSAPFPLLPASTTPQTCAHSSVPSPFPSALSSSISSGTSWYRRPIHYCPMARNHHYLHPCPSVHLLHLLLLRCPCLCPCPFHYSIHRCYPRRRE